MVHYLSQRWLLDRRRMLRGMGATLALPLLNAMSPLRAAEAKAELPRRSVFVYIPNGVNASVPMTLRQYAAIEAAAAREGKSVQELLKALLDKVAAEKR